MIINHTCALCSGPVVASKLNVGQSVKDIDSCRNCVNKDMAECQEMYLLAKGDCR
jgi:hypothetical protein